MEGWNSAVAGSPSLIDLMIGIFRKLVVSAVVLIACTGFVGAAIAWSADSLSLELATGRIGKYGWAVFTERPSGREGAGPHGGQRPCLGVASAEFLGPLIRERNSELCYGVPGYLSARTEPLFVQQDVFGGTSVVGIALARAATQILMFDQSGVKRVVATKRLSAVQAREVRMMRFRYAAIVLTGGRCVDHWVTLNAKGNALWESDTELCSSRHVSETT